MLRKDLAQLFVFGFDGTNLPTDAEALLNQNAGGVICLAAILKKSIN